MKSLELNLPTLGFVVATRAMIGAGLGLLLAERIPAPQRRAAGLVLLAIGAATTLPAILAIRRGIRQDEYDSAVF